MKVTKRKNPEYPAKAVFSDGTKVILPKQSKFKSGWLRKHGCPFVSAYEVLQYCGRKDLGVRGLYSWYKKNFGKYILGTLTIRGLTYGLKSLLKGKATVKRFSPANITVERVRRYLDAGAIIIFVRKSPTSMIHYYVLASDKGKTYQLDKGTAVKTTVAKALKKKSNNKRYGGMIVITRKKAKKK
jgi:hypothetical protein